LNCFAKFVIINQNVTAVWEAIMENQFNIGEYVTYSSNGVCLIKNIEDLSFVGGKKTKYYVLTPNSNSSTVIYVPAENPDLMSKMRHVLTKSEIDETLSNVDKNEIAWIDNRKDRIEAFQAIINKGETIELLRLVMCIYNKKQQLLRQGKKISLTDENFMRQSTSIIESEFSFVLGIEIPQVKEYIQKCLNS
jgi:CarD family transcriptional regulator